MAETRGKFVKAAGRERKSCGAPTDVRPHVLSETIEEEARAIEEFGKAVELQIQAAGESTLARSDEDDEEVKAR